MLLPDEHSQSDFNDSPTIDHIQPKNNLAVPPIDLNM